MQWGRGYFQAKHSQFAGKSQKVKTQRVKTSENFTEENMFAEDISEDSCQKIEDISAIISL